MCRADLAITVVNFLFYQNKNLIQAIFLFFPNRSCLRNFLRGLKKGFQKFLILTKEQSANTYQLNIINHVNIKGKVRKKQQ